MYLALGRRLLSDVISDPEGVPMDLTCCPECGALAEIEWRAVMESTDGPIEHAKIRCAQRHWFLLPVSSVAAARQPVQPRTQPRPAQTRHLA